MSDFKGTPLECDLLDAIEAVLDSEGGVQSMREAAEMFKRCTGSNAYDEAYNLQPSAYRPVTGHIAQPDGQADPTYCHCGRLVSEHIHRPRNV